MVGSVDESGPVRTMVLRDQPRHAVARLALGLTLYLDQPLVWAREAARAVLVAFLERVPPQELRHFSSSVRPGFRPVTGNDVAQLVRELPLPALRETVRHLFWIRIVDAEDAPTLAFSYREVDSDEQRRAGVLELTFPAEYDPPPPRS